MKCVVVAASLVPGLALAEPPLPSPVPVNVAPEPPAAEEEEPPTLEEAWRKLDELEQEQKKQKAGTAALVEQLDTFKWLRRHVTAYIDVGAFAVGGNGAGIRSDFLHQHYTEYRNTVAGQWVFMGDPFSTMVNSLGEPAETGDSREVETDTINSSGRASLIVNTVALSIAKDVGKGFSVSSLVQFLPRPGDDLVDVPLAHVNYRRPLGEIDLLVEVGKIDSVLGVEYRAQDAPNRVGVTPSLICRYTCGRPLGIDVRMVRHWFEDDHPTGWSISAALINGDTFDERFEPESELRANRYPSAVGHLQWTFPYGSGIEVGVSGMFGPQDVQPNSRIHQWHYGFDLRLFDVGGWNVTAEFVHGRQQGSTTGDPARDRMAHLERPACDVAACLTYKGAYVIVDRPMTARLTPYARVDWRDATHQQGAEFVYEANSLRATVGARYEFTPGVIAKLEYNANYEIGVPFFPHDVLTSSIVVTTE